MKVNTFYVYELWNPLNNQIFYVGKGTKYGNSYYRLSNHIKDSKYALTGKIPMNHKFRTILKIIDSGKKPEIKIVFESDDKELVSNKEIELIKLYGRRDTGTGLLCNHTDGGEGMLGYRHTKEHIHKLKTDNKGGQTTSRPVYSICPKTFNITLYPSSSNAAQCVKGVKANIHAAASKLKTRTAYGYYWRFESQYNSNEEFNKLNELRDNSYANSKEINQLTLDMEFVKTWKSASDICRAYTLSVSTLHTYIKNKRQYKGFYWRKKL